MHELFAFGRRETGERLSGERVAQRISHRLLAGSPPLPHQLLGQPAGRRSKLWHGQRGMGYQAVFPRQRRARFGGSVGERLLLRLWPCGHPGLLGHFLKPRTSSGKIPTGNEHEQRDRSQHG